MVFYLILSFVSFSMILFLCCCVESDESVSTIAESLWNEGHGSKSLKPEDKEKEPKREIDTAKEKDRYKEKYWGKSIQELDLSNCQRCTPSYRLLPDDVGNCTLMFIYLPILSASIPH